MKEIPLYHSDKVALVDDEDYEKVIAWPWYYNKRDGSVYTAFNRMEGGRTTMYLHQLLLPNAKEVDHIDCNKLNNQKSNLREVTHAQNGQNTRKHKNNTSGYRGVYCRRGTSWSYHLMVNGMLYTKGGFKTAEDAARAYDQLARKLSGPYTRLNFPNEGEQQA